MHRLPSASTVTRFRFSALLYVFVFIAIPAAVGVMIYSMIIHDQQLTLLGMALFGAGLLLALVQRIAASRARCPLCLMPPLIGKSCVKHRTARTLFGSHRLRVATSIALAGSFRCPFCGEPTAMEVRQRNPRPS